MTKADFLSTLKSDKRVELNTFACEKLEFFLSRLDDGKVENTGLLEMVGLKLINCQKRRIYADDLFNLILESLKSQATFNAKHSKIKDFKGSRYEESTLLENYFLKQELKNLGLQWLEYENAL